jgi:hypothetical protein
MDPTSSNRKEFLQGQDLLRPLTPEEYATVPDLTSEEIREALRSGAEARAQAEANARVPESFPSIRIK